MRKSVIAVLAVVAVGLAALPALAQGSASARVRVVHASPDAPTVDVLVNDTIRAFEGAAFGDITNYASLPANVYNFKVVPEGGEAADAVIDANANLFFFSNYTVVAVNTLANIEPLVLQDSELPALPQRARVRFVHASPDAPAVDIKIVGGPFLFQNVSFKGVGDYVVIPATTADVEVRVAGTDTVVLTLTGLTFRGGRNYTAYAVGFATPGAGPALTAILSEDPGSLPLRIRR